MNSLTSTMLHEGQEALAASRSRAREYRDAMFHSTMDILVKTLTANGSDFISFMGMCEPEYEVRPAKILIVWQIEPWFKISVARAIANNVGSETLNVSGYIGLSSAEPVYTFGQERRRDQIMELVAKYLSDLTGMVIEK